jgi:hypothetical protein
VCALNWPLANNKQQYIISVFFRFYKKNVQLITVFECFLLVEKQIAQLQLSSYTGKAAINLSPKHQPFIAQNGSVLHRVAVVPSTAATTTSTVLRTIITCPNVK